MKLVHALALALLGYAALVVAFEAFVGVMGRRHADRGLAAGESECVLTTTGADGRAHDTVVAGVELDGKLYVAANHWPRAWYARALARPDLALTRGGGTAPVHAVPVAGAELARVSSAYPLPLVVRVLTGFPPRRFLRLEPRA